MKERDPLFGFRGKIMEAYVIDKPLQVGDELMLYGGQYMQHSYKLVRVEMVNHGKQHRIVVSDGLGWGGCSFYRTGISCFHPKGQTYLIPVINEIKKQLDSTGSVVFDYDWKKIH